MAKGISGKTYESLTKIVLEDLIEDGVIHGEVFWNVKPPTISVEPDFLIGADVCSPAIVFAVSHGDSPKESNRKCWRNISELSEMKTRLRSTPLAVNIVFDSHIKKDIMELQSGAFDAQLVIGDMEYGATVTSWVKRNMKKLPKDQNDKVACLRERRKTDATLNTFLDKIKSDLQAKLSGISEHSPMKSLWESERKHIPKTIPIAKRTCFKRGFAKRVFVGKALDKAGRITSEANTKLLCLLGLIKLTVHGYDVCDNELLQFMNTPTAGHYAQTAKKCTTKGFLNQIEKVENLALVDIGIDFVFDHYEDLITPAGMQKTIELQMVNPSAGIIIPPTAKEPNNIWIYDIVASLIKAAEGKSQAFGYSFFATHPLSNTSKVGTITIGDWCARFAGEFFNRKSNIKVPPNAILLISTVMSEYLSHYPKHRIPSLKSSIIEQYILKEYEKTLLSHRGFSPLQQLLIDEGIVQRKPINIKTCFAEKASLTGQSGSVSICISNSGKTVIKCLSANKNPSDKRKELYGQAVGIRYVWDSSKKQFCPRPGLEKMILFLDGTWTKKDLNLLVQAGWDEIYYPDEIDKLKAAIV